jgi:hypothetical protein
MRRIRLAAIVVALVAFFASCATAPKSVDDRRLLGLLGEIDAADAAGAAELSDLPFVFDQEVIVRRSDLDLLWSELKVSGLRLASARVVAVAAVRDPVSVGSTFLLQAFGGHVAEEPVSIVEIEAADGPMLLLVESRGLRGYRLRGMRRMM